MKHMHIRAAFVALAIGSAALLLAGCQHSLTEQESRNAEYGAIKYSQAAGTSFVGCSGLDSDGDSYVTCTTKKPGGGVEALVCSYEGTSAGCKAK